MNRRRKTLAALGTCLLNAPLASFAHQPGNPPSQPGKLWRVGFLAASNLGAGTFNGFTDGMREIGYIEGKNLKIEWRIADGERARLPGLAAELAAMQVDAIVAEGSASISAAKILGIEVFSTNVGRREDFAPVAAQLRKWHADALYVTSNPSNTNNRQLLADFTASVRLPAIYGFRGYVEAGGFMSYGPSEAGLYRRAAYYVDRSFKGAKPADLPVEQPTRFELVINGKTAKALGLKIPQSLLITAEMVIE